MDRKTSDDFTLTLIWSKLLSSINFIFFIALSTKASGHGSLYFSNKSCSKDPALTPILIEHSLYFADLIISFNFSLPPIFPGLILKHFAPLSAASIALL